MRPGWPRVRGPPRTRRTKKLCAGIEHVRAKITGVALTPGSPVPEFDVDAAPLNDAERIVLTFSNWCRMLSG